MKIKKILSTTGKVLGTVAVGGVGLVFGACETGASSTSKEASKSFGNVKEGCFDMVKKMWDPTSTSKDFSESFSSTLHSVSDIGGAFDTIANIENEKNREKLRTLLEQHGLDPALADDKEALQKKLDELRTEKSKA